MKKTMVSIGSAVILLFLGLIYAWSIFVAPLENEFGWTRDQTSLTFTICMSFFCIGILAASQLRKKFNANTILLTCSVAILIAFILISRLNSLWQLYLFYGVICGFAVGCAYNCILSIIPLYYPKRVGLINGIMLFCFGMGGFILGAIAKKIMNIYDWRMTFVYLGIIFLIIFLVFSFFIKPPQIASESQKAEVLGETGLTPLQMMKHPYFYIFFLWQVAINGTGLALIGHAASIANEIRIPGGLLALAVGVIAASSGIGKFLFGLLYDLKRRAFTMTLASLLGLVGTIILLICLNSFSMPLLFIGFFCCGASYGSSPACNATFTRKQFGSKHFSTNFGINSLTLLVAAFTGSYLIGIIRTQSGKYDIAIIILVIYMVLSVILSLLMRKERE